MRLKTLGFGDREPRHFSEFRGNFLPVNLDHAYCFNTSNNAHSYMILAPQTLSEVITGFFINPQASSTQNQFAFAQDGTVLATLRYNYNTTRYEILDSANNVQGISTIYGPYQGIHVQPRLRLGASGMFEIKINHTAETLTFNSNISGSKINRLYFYATNNGTYIDSLWINDTTGAYNNGYDGVVHMWDLPFIDDDPDDNEFAKYLDPDGWKNIGIPSQDPSLSILLDWNYADLNALKQAYVPGPHPVTAPGVIIGYTHTYLADKVSSGAVTPYVKIGTNRYAGATQQIGVTPAPFQDRRILHPSGANWALADLPNFGLQSSL